MRCRPGAAPATTCPLNVFFLLGFSRSALYVTTAGSKAPGQQQHHMCQEPGSAAGRAVAMQLSPAVHRIHAGAHGQQPVAGRRSHSLVLSMDWPHHHLSLGVTAAVAMACMEGSAARWSSQLVRQSWWAGSTVTGLPCAASPAAHALPCSTLQFRHLPAAHTRTAHKLAAHPQCTWPAPGCRTPTCGSSCRLHRPECG